MAAPRVAEAANRKAGTSEDQERRSESRKAAARSRELQAKIAELETANNDLHNLLASSDIATVCLDWALHIKWFTPATRAMLNVIATDVGRPIRDLASPLAGESLLHDAGVVLDKLAPVQTELEAPQGRWYLRRVVPYRTEDDDHVDGVIVTFSDITDSRRKADADLEARQAVTDDLEKQVRERTSQLRALSVELTLAEDRERNSIAHDLHDELGQLLNLAKLKLETTMRNAAAGGQGNGGEHAEIGQLLEQASRSVRSLAAQLSPPVLQELGLIPALQWLAEQMGQTYGLAVELKDDGADLPLDQVCRSIAFRAVRELLINVAKHANVASALVDARRDGDSLEIVVSDHGLGFDPTNMQKAATGLGLLGMRERLHYIGGDIEIVSAPGRGTRVRLRLPLTRPASRS